MNAEKVFFGQSKCKYTVVSNKEVLYKQAVLDNSISKDSSILNFYDLRKWIVSCAFKIHIIFQQNSVYDILAFLQLLILYR